MRCLRESRARPLGFFFLSGEREHHCGCSGDISSSDTPPFHPTYSTPSPSIAPRYTPPSFLPFTRSKRVSQYSVVPASCTCSACSRAHTPNNPTHMFLAGYPYLSSARLCQSGLSLALLRNLWVLGSWCPVVISHRLMPLHPP